MKNAVKRGVKDSEKAKLIKKTLLTKGKPTRTVTSAVVSDGLPQIEHFKRNYNRKEQSKIKL